MPASLPVSCLTMAPRLDMLESFNRKPLTEKDMNNSPIIIQDNGKENQSPCKNKQNYQASQKSDHDIDTMLKNLEDQLKTVFKHKPDREMGSSGMIISFTLIKKTCVSINFSACFSQKSRDLFKYSSIIQA